MSVDEMLPAAFIDCLQIDNDVTYDTLKYMIINQRPELAEVIPSIGARIALQNYFNYDLKKERQASPESFVTPISTPSVTPTLTLAIAPQEMLDPLVVTPQEMLDPLVVTPQEMLDSLVVVPLDKTPVSDDMETPTENITQSLLVEVSPSVTNDTQNIIILNNDKELTEIQKIETVENLKLESFDLKALLQKTVTGQAIIASYNTRSGLPLKRQQYLANIIICYFFDNNVNVQLNNDKLNKIANHIITLFPAECKEVYYCPPVKKKDSKNHKSGIARGKLVDKNRNMLAFLRKCQLIRSSSEKVQDKDSLNEANTDNGEDEVEQRESHNWLRNNFEPWEEVLYHWEKSFVFRKNLIHDHTTYRNLVSIFDDWNILTSSKGYVLIEKDYLRLHKDTYKNVQEKFNLLFDAVLELRGKELDCTNKLLLDMLDSTIPNGIPKAHASSLENIFLGELIYSGDRETFGNKVSFKPIINELIHLEMCGITICVDNNKKKRNWLQKFRLTLQPFIVVVGPSITEIQSIFVRIDDISYKVKTVFKALEICFMSFVVLDLKYPPAAEHI
ncbi:PREDICTED: uncharacterized protein LOC108766410, partial [Trachymyrmex cornetzi]|uniref:uncharacterized protein LOC108766410 n=1 Tax=Trachymyrmex cornetzi TaxID=471704 RepID=UPI00084F08F1